MDVIEAITARTSVRDFTSSPIEKETIMKILETATLSPSGGNGQPWELFVAAGETIERIRQQYQEQSLNRQAAPGGPGGPPPQPDYIRERMATIRKERLELLRLDPADPESGKVFQEWGARLFGVPVLVVICMDGALTNNLDIGLLIQTLCLSAQGYGISSFIAGAFVSQRDILRQELEIPENLNIITGVGLGYPNNDNIINTYRSPRRPIEEVVRYRD
ncbi:MAG: nitroreductase [Dehalococcoidales bacterium]